MDNSKIRRLAQKLAGTKVCNDIYGGMEKLPPEKDQSHSMFQ